MDYRTGVNGKFYDWAENWYTLWNDCKELPDGSGMELSKLTDCIRAHLYSEKSTVSHTVKWP